MNEDIFSKDTEVDVSLLNSLIAEAGGERVSIFEELKAVELRYLVSTHINQGGIKKIFRSRDSMTGRPVAMAKLRGASTPEAVEHFLREARIMAHLEHPNIVPVYDVGINEEGDPFFTMKLLSGENLGVILHKLREEDPEYIQKYTRPELVDIFLKVCDAMGYAHAMGIIHLDLKPENIHVSDYGEVLVCDWGLAKIADSDCESDQSLLDDDSLYASCVNFLTIDGTLKGTPGYMAPEQTSSQGVKNTKTDIYSLGAILYAVLTTHCPVEGDDIAEVLDNTRNGRIEPPRKRTPERVIPQSLAAVAMKALALNPAVRYDHAEQISKDIHAFRDGFATFAEDAGFVTQLSLLAKRNKRESLLVVSALILIAVVVMFYTLELKTKARETRLALEASELNFKKFKREKRFRENIESAPEYYYEALAEYEEGRYSQAKDLIDFALQYDAYLFRGWELKGHLEFILRDFQAAAESYKKVQSATGDQWAAIAQQFGRIPRKADGSFELSALMKILGGLPREGWEPMIAPLLIEVTRYDLKPSDQVKLANTVIRRLSPRGGFKGSVKNTPKGIVVNLSKHAHEEGLWILLGMKLEELSLAGGGFRDMSMVGRLHARKVNISGMKKLDSLSGFNAEGVEEVNLSGSTTRGINKLRDRHLKKLSIVGAPNANEEWLRQICEDMQVDVLEMSKSVEVDPELMDRLTENTQVVLK